MSVLEAVVGELAGVPVQRVRHPEARTTAELAAARGLPVEAGLKALLMKMGCRGCQVKTCLMYLKLWALNKLLLLQW